MIQRNAYRALPNPTLSKSGKLRPAAAPRGPVASEQRTLKRDIREFLYNHQMLPTSFGRLALKDAAFVGKVRSGWQPDSATIEKVRAFMAARDAGISPHTPDEAARQHAQRVITDLQSLAGE